MNLWIVGRYRGDAGEYVAWDFQGVFDSEEKAIGGCLDETYFVAPAVLNEGHEDTVTEWPACYYPLAESLT